ncbi:MAG TPA: ECF transporter S component [Dehalococcoidia bacterium]|nr:ECF transporter S component [Dehalococcoidia bacterium]
MINRIAISKPQPLPLILKYTDARSYIFTAVFVALAVLVPWVCHQFHLAGATFLPMHVFVMIAGLMFGWRAGVATGLLTPLISYLTSGMPVLSILPQITVEISTYGLVAGALRERYHLRTLWALLGAMVGGRLVLLATIVIVYLITGESHSPLGQETSPFLAFWAAVKQGWPGIVIQLVSIPLIVWLAAKLLSRKGQTGEDTHER